MTFRMRPASKTCRRPAAIRRLRPSRKSAGLPSPMFPPTSLAAGVPAAHRPTEKTQRIEAQVKRCGDEDRHLRSLSLRLRPIWIFDRLKKERRGDQQTGAMETVPT